MNYWFTADTHFGHTNIIKYCNRPFTDIREHDETLIKNWNEIVLENDGVYFLGDFCFGDAWEYIKRLNGSIYFIIGSHDSSVEKFFDDSTRTVGKHECLGEQKEIKVKNQIIVLNHYPMLRWSKSHYGSFQLHGHCHGKLPDDPNALMIDVGVDCHYFRPINLDKITEIMGKKTFIPIKR